MLYHILKDSSELDAPHMARLLIFLGVAFSFLVTFIAIILFKDKLPRDGGRDFAVDGKKSAGKGRGAGVIFVAVFCASSVLFFPLSAELIIYLIVIMLTRLSGYLDDAAKTPWGEYKKGIIDFAIALACAITFVYFNGSTFTIVLLRTDITLPSWLFVILAVILIWVSINVVNCSDGVDGLSASLAIVTMLAFYFIFDKFQYYTNLLCAQDSEIGTSVIYKGLILSFIACLIAYLWFNAAPSILMMGDAGSRAMGMFIAILALKCGAPLLFIPLALAFILDGGLGLLKIVCIRFLKLKGFMKNIRTPLHDHVRKNFEPAWSPTQVVFRFSIINLFICSVYLGLLLMTR